MKQKIYISRLLKKTNISFTILIIIFNLLTFFIADSNKDTFISLSIFFNCFLFFLYRFRINTLASRNWIAIKKEIMYINYPITIGIFFLLIFAIFCADIYSLSQINKDALNVTFIFTYFMSTISMLLPAILLLVYMYLICPAFVIPSFEQRKRKSKTDLILLLLFIIFIIFSGVQIITNTVNTLTVSTREKFKAVKLPVKYPKQYLKYTDLSAATEETLKREDIKIPFLYTAEGFSINNYNDAEQFCNSLNAKVASHLEIYNIIFHRFDTYGEKYYWTRDKAGRNNLLLHFKNMSYEIIKNPGNVKPILYCTSDANPDSQLYKPTHFFRVKPVEIGGETNIGGKMNINAKKTVTYPPQNIEKMKVDLTKKQGQDTVEDDTAKHVNFNVRHVDEAYFNELLSQGYTYEEHVQVNSYYESSEFDLDASINRDPNLKNIRLCYYPFIEYKNMHITNEAQIWRQSLCSPSFDIINIAPVLKTRHQKDAYCYANGCRLPNSPELMGILKTCNAASKGAKYWTNNKITSSYNDNDAQLPIAIKVTDPRFVTAEAIESTDEAYTFCVKNPEKKSRILANFRSRYRGDIGTNYAKKICQNCKYYEVPDTVLLRQ